MESPYNDHTGRLWATGANAKAGEANVEIPQHVTDVNPLNTARSGTWSHPITTTQDGYVVQAQTPKTGAANVETPRHVTDMNSLNTAWIGTWSHPITTTQHAQRNHKACANTATKNV